MSLRSAIAQLDEERGELVLKKLQVTGWAHRCDAPGARWYWTREWRGARWTAWNDQQAYEIQLSIESQKSINVQAEACRP